LHTIHYLGEICEFTYHDSKWMLNTNIQHELPFKVLCNVSLVAEGLDSKILRLKTSKFPSHVQHALPVLYVYLVPWMV